MNKIYRKVWSRARKQWVVASEVASSKGAGNGSAVGGTVDRRGGLDGEGGESGLNGARPGEWIGFAGISAIALLAAGGLSGTAQAQVFINNGGAGDTSCEYIVDNGQNGAVYATGSGNGDCDASDRATQTNRALFYSTAGYANNLTLGGRLDVNSGQIGVRDVVGGTYSLRMGSDPTVGATAGNTSIAIGMDRSYATVAASAAAIAIGNNATIDGNSASAVAYGQNTGITYAQNALALGGNAKVNGASGNGNASNFSMAIGTNASIGAGSASSIAQGYTAGVTYSSWALALGNGAKVNGASGNVSDGAMAIGLNSAVAAGSPYAIAQGASSSVSGSTAIAIGASATTRSAYSIALGGSTSIDANSASSVAQGYSAGVTYSSWAVALGNGAKVNGASGNTSDGAMAIGLNSSVAAGSPSAIAQGVSSSASGNSAVAIGPSATTRSSYSVALGSNTSVDANSASSMAQGNGAAVAYAKNAIAVGNGAKVKGTSNSVSDNAMAIGNGATVAASAQNAIAQGNGANAGSANAVAIGHGATGGSTTAPTVGTSDTSGIAIGGGAWSNWGVAIGDQAKTSTSGYGVSIGRQTSTGLRGTALGFSTSANGVGSVGIGDKSQAQSDQSVAIGSQAAVDGNSASSMAQGNGAAVTYAQNAIALGTAAKVNGASGNVSDGSMAIGNGAAVSAGATDAIAQGSGAQAQSAQSVAIGKNATAKGGKAVSIGMGNTANGDGSVAIGDPNNAGTASVAMGRDNNANASNGQSGGVALGDTNTAAGLGAVALGSKNDAEGQGSIALGNQSTTTSAGGIALGDTAASKAQNALAFGANAVANNAGDVALGAGSTTSMASSPRGGTIDGTTYQYAGVSPSSVVSVGAQGKERQITNVAAGNVNANSTDAINGSQLAATNQAVNGVGKRVDQLGNSAATVLGGNAAYDQSTGKLTMSNVGGTGENTVNDAIKSVAATANTGWNVQANGDTATQVKPGDTVQFKDGQNIKVTRNGTDVTVATADDLTATSITTGNSKLDTNGLTIANGPSVLASGIDAGGKKITSVAAGDVSSSSTDAINGSQLYTTNQNLSTVATNTSKYLGGGADVQNGTAPSYSVGGSTYNNAGDAFAAVDSGKSGVVQRTSTADVTTMVASGGTAANPGNAQKLTNLAAGDVTSSSKDAVNGSQLYAVQQTANAGWNVQANGDTATQVKPGDTVQFKDGQNIKVTRNGTDITVATADDLTATSITTGNSKLDTNGLAITNGPSVLASGIDAGGKKITSVAAGDVSSSSTDAINGSQLYTTNQNLNTVASNTSKYLGGGADVQNGTAPSYSIGGATYNNAGDAFSAVDSGKAGVVQRTSTADVTTMVASGGTAANPGNAQKLTNLAAGTLSSSSTDAVNGSQLYAVQQTANAGWNVQANGDTATQVKPGDTVQFKDGQNIKVTRNGTDVTVATADDLTAASITTGNSKLDTNGLAITNGPSVLASGIDAGGKKITSVAAGDVSATSTDAINGSQLNTTNQNLSTVATNTSKYLGGGADVQNGTAPSYSIGGTTYNNAGDAFAAVDSGKSGVVQRTSTADVTTMVASGGTAANAGNAQKLTNLAAGTLSASSTDAVNGSQLYAAGSSAASVLGGNAAYNTTTGNLSMSNVGGTGKDNVNDAIASVAATAGTGWNVQANGDTATQVKPGDTVQFKDGQNIKVTRNGTDITVATADDLTATSITTGNSRLDNGGLKVDDGTNATTYAANGITIANGPSVTSNGIDAGGKKITSVAAGDVLSSSTDAINGSQLYTTNQNLSTVASNTSKYLGGGADVQNGTAPSYSIGGATYNNAGDAFSAIDSGKAGVVQRTSTADVTTMVASGGTAANPGNAQKLTNLAAGTLSGTSTDAVNGSQLYAVQQTANAGWNVQANGDTATQVKPGDTVQFKDGQNIKVTRNGTDVTVATADDLSATSLTAGNSRLDTSGLKVDDGTNSTTYAANGITIANGPSVTINGIDAGGKKITSVAAGDVSATSTDAINGSQLNTTNQNLSTVATNTSKYLGGGADVQNGTAPSYSIGGTTYNNAGDAFAAVDSGKSGVVQRTSTADVTTMVASGGTAANPGNAQKLTNLAAGTLSASSTDAVNGSQLFTTNSMVNSLSTTVSTSGSAIASLSTGLSSTNSSVTSLSTSTSTGLSSATSSIASLSTSTSTGIGSLSTALSSTDSSVSSLSTSASTGLSSANSSITSLSTSTSTAINAAKTHYYSVNDNGTQQANYNNDGATGTNALAAGTNAKAAGASSVAVGDGSNAQSAGAVAIGQNASATGGKAVSIGSGNTASGDGAVAIGDPNVATGTGAVAMGANNTATGDGAVSLGNQNTATGASALALGSSNQASADNTIALGSQATANAVGSQAYGSAAKATAADALAFGTNAQANVANSIALGANSVTTAAVGTSSATIGGVQYFFAGSSPVGVVSVGAPGAERQITNVAAGRISATSTDVINGSQLNATNNAINTLSTSTASNVASLSTGINSLSTGLSATNSNVASLSTSTSTAVSSLSTGLNTTNSNLASLSTSTSTGMGSLSTGLSTTNSNLASLSTGVTNINNTLSSLSTTINNNNVRSVNSNGIAADMNGTGSDAPKVTAGSNSAAIGANSTDGGRQNVVSVGSDTQQRQVINVAPGTQGTDAVNMNQLTQVQTTLSTALSGQQSQINSLGSQLQQTDQMARQGIAAVGAMASIPQLDRDANFGMGMGASTFLGQKAIAVNMQARITENLKASINGGFSGGQKVIGAGMLYQWK